ncbi:MAG: glycosyltransferase family 9 protein [Muribaculum sp.]|nr:glycosyltransferase family 9 protein [Muribaculum sp.]
MTNKKECVLAIRFSALGDVAMTIPELYDACIASPDTTFVMLTRPNARSIFANPPANLHLETPDLDRYKGLIGLIRLYRYLKRKWHFTVMVDLHDVVRSQVLRALGRLDGVRIGRIRKGRGSKRALTRRLHKLLVPLRATTDRYRDAFIEARLPQLGAIRSIFPESGADPSLFAAASPPRRPGEHWIGIAPFAKHPGKIYPPAKMEEVVAHFASVPDTKVFLFGFGQEEGSILSAWSEKYRGVTDLSALRLGMTAEMALMSHCDAVVSMDSANMHLASLAGTRVVSVWGATHPYAGFMGWHQNPADAVQLDMTCRPCSIFGNKPCLRGDYHCLHGISPQMIIDRINNDASLAE